jgi:alkyl sulfatase BDS1-like metallo-beta-lactamase superfamily hydrolase
MKATPWSLTAFTSLLRQSVLNNNYGLYEVIPGIYQVRGLDLSDISFVKGKTGWMVFDPLVTAAQHLHAARCTGP